MDLSTLLRRAAAGDEDAFAELYDATSSRVYGLTLRILRDHHQADEVTQEVLLQLWQTSSNFDAHRGSALSWVVTLAHRRAVDRVRAVEASTRRDLEYAEKNYANPFDQTSVNAHASIEAHQVRAAVQTLSATQRQALELAYFRGFNYREVSQLLNVPLGTVKTRIRGGMRRLRDTLSTETGYPDVAVAASKRATRTDPPSGLPRTTCLT